MVSCVYANGGWTERGWRPVTLIVGCGQGGCQLQPTILGVVNAGSFQPGGAPRAIMAIFGTTLSDGTYTATTSHVATVWADIGDRKRIPCATVLRQSDSD